EVGPKTLQLIEENKAGADWMWGRLETIDEESRPDGEWPMDLGEFPITVGNCKNYMRGMLSLYPTMVAAFRVSWLRENNLRAVGFKTTKQYADTLTGWNWLKANPRLRYIPEVFARYRRWGGAESARGNPSIYQQEFAQILRDEERK
ncbi:MAG: hypothetical protein WC657_06580, partial [Candidatus Paceibacterota bacterium]